MILPQLQQVRKHVQVKQNAVFKMTHDYSFRYGFSVTLESSLERDYFNFRHYENDFPFFEMQPDRIYYKSKNGHQTPYGADGRYIDENGEEHLDEVKYLIDANTPKNKLKHKLIEQHCVNHGIYFSVLTEIDIRVGERAANLCYLHPCWSLPSPVEELSQLCKKIDFTEATIQKWSTACTKNGFPPSLIRRAIAHKLIKCDITQPWTNLYLTV
jgi:hypothetical protein